MAAKYSLEEKVENYFASLRPRYRPFSMHQYCTQCGKELHRNQFQMRLFGQYRNTTNPQCKWCMAVWRRTGEWPTKFPPTPWESPEMMKARLLEEFGTAEYRMLGIVHRAPYKLSKAHRQAIRAGVIAQRSSKK